MLDRIILVLVLKLCIYNLNLQMAFSAVATQNTARSRMMCHIAIQLIQQVPHTETQIPVTDIIE